MKKLVVISLVGCLLGANQLFGDLKEFNALAKRGGRANSQRLLEIYATLTSPQEKVSAQSTLRRLGIDFRQAQAAAASTIPVAPAVPAIPAARRATPPVPSRSTVDTTNAFMKLLNDFQRGGMSADAMEDALSDLLDQHPNYEELGLKPTAVAMGKILEQKKKEEAEFVILNTQFLSGTMSTATMEKALNEFRSKFPTSTEQIKTLEDVLKKTIEAQAEAKESKEEIAKEVRYAAIDAKNTAQTLTKADLPEINALIAAFGADSAKGKALDAMTAFIS